MYALLPRLHEALMLAPVNDIVWVWVCGGGNASLRIHPSAATAR